MSHCFSRIVLTDVYYSPTKVQAAGLVISSWQADTATEEYIYQSPTAQDYVAGEFYQRELPHLLQLLALIKDVDCVVVDAHVWLQANQPGCGHYLWEQLGKKIPVIGVAKNAFHQGVAKPLLRGTSKKPLYISAVGIEVDAVIPLIASMHGDFRIPALLRQVDQLSRR